MLRIIQWYPILWNIIWYHKPLIEHDRLSIWICSVVDLPLWKMMEFVSWDDDIPNCFWKVIIHSCSSQHQPGIYIFNYIMLYNIYNYTIVGYPKKYPMFWIPMFQSAPTTGIHVPGAMAHCTRVDIFFACAAARPLEKAMMICASNASEGTWRNCNAEGAAVKHFGVLWVEKLENHWKNHWKNNKAVLEL